MRVPRRSVLVLVAATCVASASAPRSEAPGYGTVRAASIVGCPANVPTIDEDWVFADVAGQNACALVAAGAAGAVSTGDGVKVAVLDGGFDLRHEYLAGRLGDEWDAIDQDGDAQDLGNDSDDDQDQVTDRCVGHGTFVAGVVAACAPDATILPIRVLDDEGLGDPSALARGIDKAVELGADVINLSLVATTAPEALQEAIQDAIDAGVVIVTSAGNDPTGPFDASFLEARAIEVGGVDGNLLVTDFSPNASWVDLFAPGDTIVGPLGGDVEDCYATWSGTSFSCAFVAAAAALVRELEPAWGTSTMRTHLMAATDAVTNAVPSNTGSIDLYQAVTE